MTRSVFPWNSVISYPEAVPSINYIGRQLDVSYIGRQVYGEIIDLSKAVPSINYIGRQLDVSYFGRQMYGEISIYQIKL